MLNRPVTHVIDMLKEVSSWSLASKEKTLDRTICFFLLMIEKSQIEITQKHI